MKMKKLFWGIGVIGLAVLSYSCGDETTGLAPDITFDDGAEITLGQGVSSVAVTGKIVAEEKLDEVTLYKVTGTSETQIGSKITSFNAGTITTTDDLNYNFRIELADITEDMSLKIEAVDKAAQTASKSISIKITSAPALKAEFTAVIMGAQSSTKGSCLDANTGTVYKISGDEAKTNASLVDMLYYYGSTNQATLAAPNDGTVDGTSGDFSWTSSWSTKNATKFGESALSYGSVTAGQVNAISGLSSTKVTGLTVGKTIEFVLSDGKKGVLNVTALTTGASGEITVAVKVQE
jgi:hypothetical protein